MLDAIPTEKRLDYVDKNLNQKRSVKLKTCADVYGHWRSHKRAYKKAPEDGVEFQIDYIDTGLSFDEQTRSLAPIVLALHGAPGSYHDFALLIQHLSKQKVRVIAPNFPEYIATVKTKVLFRHSADEKAAYLRDFLQAIGVNKIDLLVSHSSAIFPTLLILLNANNEAIAREKRERQVACDGNKCLDRTQATTVAMCSQQQSKARQQCIMRRGGERSSDDNNASDNQNNNNYAEENNNTNNNRSAAEKVASRCSSTSENIGWRAAEEVVDAKQNIQAEHDSAIESYEDDDEEEAETFEDARDEIRIDNNNNNEKSIDSDDTRAPRRATPGNANNDNSQPLVRLSGKDTNGTSDCAINEPALHEAGGRLTKLKKRRSNKKTDVIVKFEQPIEIKAVALLNPAGHRLPKSMKPAWFKCGSVHIYQHKLGRSLYRKFGPAFLTLIGVPVRVDNMDNVMLSATVMRNSKCQRVIKQLQQLSEMKIPTLFVFSENDKLIEKEIFYEMTQFMRLDSKKFDVFNNDGDIELSQALMDDWIRVMVFKAGGHYAYSNYAKTVNQAVSDLLANVRSKTNK